MINKIKVILRYITSPKYIIKGIKNPKRIFIFFKKDLIFEPEDFIFKITEKNRSKIKKYLKEIKEKREFNDYIWNMYNDFEKELIKKKKDTIVGGISKEMGMILYTIIRLLKPENVLETGIASGISSAYILAALKDNQKGKLISIDLPYEVGKDYPPDYIKEEGKTFIPKNKTPGWLIPEELKNRWQCLLGKSSEKLPEILKDISFVDFFLHDSEHSYQNMFWEYETVWSFLKKEGLLLSHDINWNKAFDDFCAKVNRKGIKYREEFGGIKKTKSYEKKIDKFFFSCPICDSSHLFKIYGVSVFDVCLCRFCGLVCLNPRMDEKGYMETLIKNYRRDLFGDYLADPFNFDEPPSETIKSPVPNKVFNDLKNYLLSNSKILEVGCGAGEELILFKQNGFNNLTGIDPSSEYPQSLKNFYDIECYDKSLSEFAEITDKKKKFDCIILNNVIEHFVEPDNALKTINNLMAENGVLYIRTPDLYKFSKPFSQFCIPHTFYFSQTTLENLLKKCGFKVKRYFDDLISDEMVLLAEKEKNIEPIKYDHDEYKRVFSYLKKNRILFIFFKSKRFIEEIFMKVFGEDAYLRIRCFFKNCAVALIKKYRKYKK